MDFYNVLPQLSTADSSDFGVRVCVCVSARSGFTLPDVSLHKLMTQLKYIA